MHNKYYEELFNLAKNTESEEVRNQREHIDNTYLKNIRVKYLTAVANAKGDATKIAEAQAIKDAEEAQL